MFDVRLLSVCGGLAVVFALRRRHIADRSGLRTHRKNTNRVHWSGNAPSLSTSIRCNAVAAHPQEHGSSGRESSRKYAALPVHRNQPDSATTEARRGSAKTGCATHLGEQAHLAAAIWPHKKTFGGSASSHNTAAPLSANVTVSAYVFYKTAIPVFTFALTARYPVSRASSDRLGWPVACLADCSPRLKMQRLCNM